MDVVTEHMTLDEIDSVELDAIRDTYRRFIALDTRRESFARQAEEARKASCTLSHALADMLKVYCGLGDLRPVVVVDGVCLALDGRHELVIRPAVVIPG